MKKLRMGLVGAGRIATARHIPAYMTLPQKVDVTAICDIHVQRAEEVARAYSIPRVFEDYRDMLNEVDAVTICTPNTFHADIAIAALKANVHVLSEKPMALTTKECASMIAAAKQTKKILSIGYHYRFMKQSQAAKKLMMHGEIGHPLVVRVQALRRRKVPGWGVFTQKELQGGGSLIDYGCHLLDLALWLIGHPQPLEIMGSTYNALSKTPGQVNEWGKIDSESFDVDDHAVGFVKFANDVTLFIESSWAANIREDVESLSISGDRGGLDVFPLQLNYTKHGMLFNTESPWLPGCDDPGLAQAENFVSACLGEADVIVKPEEAMAVSQIIEAIYESSESRKSVQFEKGKEISR
ncbi:Gfo/Idh/MocA family protein [Novibacillus thermophilus]|uniref:Dehydrogenase n=1 Tax=Novibacillus thermophilus TaxID=1471761 RepID=A0A1U9K8S3_9BACL|nr:Gfo/Idh/MocA family oxidoreductase [Novibacillus thermophilus]AQS56393.1 dehydrogenase [Novibacillus thermophilus]